MMQLHKPVHNPDRPELALTQKFYRAWPKSAVK